MAEPEPAPEVRAAMRDASFANSPGVAARYHVVVDGHPACNQTNRSMVLVTEADQPAETIPESLRCQRPACRKLWPPVVGHG